MQIREFAQHSGVSAKTIRYYESLGLLPPADRRDNNYCDYDLSAEEHLGFIASTRSLGFTLAEIGELPSTRSSSCSTGGSPICSPCARICSAFAPSAKRYPAILVKAVVASFTW